MPEMPGTTVGTYLIESLAARGLRHVFGIQGDYILNFYSQLARGPLEVINTCDEQGAGFAADAYARVTGLGAVCVTFGVGGLKLANSTAQAYAEYSPVLIISGAPGISEREGDPLLHHKVRSYDTQLNVFREMTSAHAVLDDPSTAAAEIERVLDTIEETRRPGYIELPRDVVQEDLPEAPPERGAAKASSEEARRPDSSRPPRAEAAAAEPLNTILQKLSTARRPVLSVGFDVHRFGLQSVVLRLLERSGIPFVTGVLSKSVLPEDHPQFLGVYAGGMSPDGLRDAVEDSDCFIVVGPLVTDLATGMFTHQLEPEKVVVISRDSVVLASAVYSGLEMRSVLESLAEAVLESSTAASPPARREPVAFVPRPGDRITMTRLLQCIDSRIDEHTIVIAEPGDALFGSLDLTIRCMSGFISPAYYASIGFSVPASIGAQLGAPGRRPLVITGDGSFQMTGMELSVSARYRLNPVVVILNNGGYGTFRPMIDGEFNDIHPWRYSEIVRVLGRGLGFTVNTEEECCAAFDAAERNDSSPTIIDVRLERHDVSDRLLKLTGELRKRTG